MREWKYIPGDPWAICDLCGKKIRKSETRINWKNQVVCENDYERKHPQLDLEIPNEENIAVENARPRPPDYEVEAGTITRTTMYRRP